MKGIDPDNFILKFNEELEKVIDNAMVDEKVHGDLFKESLEKQVLQNYKRRSPW